MVTVPGPDYFESNCEVCHINEPRIPALEGFQIWKTAIIQLSTMRGRALSLNIVRLYIRAAQSTSHMWDRSNKSEPPEPFIFSRIGAKTTINGQIQSKEDLYIDGNVRGDLIQADSCRLILGPNARVTANARARDIVILGQLNGDVEASGKTSVRRNGSLIGDIRTAGVAIEDDAFFRGKIDIINNGDDREAAPKAMLTEAAGR
jgi:cytoskeletal protein CcmA (bactofilin family)